MGKCEAEHTAREVTQHFTSSWGSQKMPMPKKLKEDEEAPKEINSYSDGSLKNPVGNHWAIGGVGLWWPGRCDKERPLNEEEGKYLEHEWTKGGCMLWTSLNELSNSSTRCEAGGARWQSKVKDQSTQALTILPQ